MQINAKKVQKELNSIANPKKAEFLMRFFRTGKGEYGEGDIFYGITVPQTRKIAQKYSGIELEEISWLLGSKIHEERLCGLLILVHKFQKGGVQEKKSIFDFYISNIAWVNNWDLVDLSADKIVGEYLAGRREEMHVLEKLAKSDNLWERRISIVATFALIKRNEWKQTFKISKMLLNDRHDLIHKAVGWMLREVGKRAGVGKLEEFLEKNAAKIPRTTLRYAIERMPEAKRKKWMGA